MLARSGRFFVGIGAALLIAVAANSFSAEAIRSPSDLYGPRTGTAVKRRRAPAGATAFGLDRRHVSLLEPDRDRCLRARPHAGRAGPVEEPPGRVFGEQLGPGRSARAMAIVHIAMFDAVNAITGGYRSYTGMARETRPASIDAAIATAAHDTLVQMFPSQKSIFDRLYNEDIARIPPSQEQRKNLGVAIGNRAATRILGRRANDGSQSRSRVWEPSGSPAMPPGTGARIRSARRRSRSARTGARCGRS